MIWRRKKLKCLNVVILTKSRKNGGICVACIDVCTGNLIRLISNDIVSHGALRRLHIRCYDGYECEPLDRVRIPILDFIPSENQPENVLINERKYWKLLGREQLEDVLQHHPPERHEFLFCNVNPYIVQQDIDTIDHSLILAEVYDIIFSHPNAKSTKASFIYGCRRYRNYSVTDPDYYDIPDDTKLDEAILIISLPEVPFEGYGYYKFIAKIFEVE